MFRIDHLDESTNNRPIAKERNAGSLSTRGVTSSSPRRLHHVMSLDSKYATRSLALWCPGPDSNPAKRFSQPSNCDESDACDVPTKLYQCVNRSGLLARTGDSPNVESALHKRPARRVGQFGAQGRTRTGTSFRTADFKSAASTNSATRARGGKTEAELEPGTSVIRRGELWGKECGATIRSGREALLAANWRVAALISWSAGFFDDAIDKTERL